jgi:N-dimethylarginine dimethylaminohydrolase
MLVYIIIKKVLLCPPTHFDVVYEINPWMHKEIQPDKKKALESYTQIKEKYRELGVEVFEIPQVKGLPDMVYTANVGYLRNSTFIRANFKYEQRRKEADYAERYIEKHFDAETVALPDDVYFEGQGDLLTDGERFFFGWGKRSDKKAIPYLEDFLNNSVIDFELVNPFYYHLDTCFAPLTHDIVVINPKSFTEEGKKKVYKSFKHVIEASEEDNKALVCNLVHIDKTIIVGQGITTDLKDKLGKFGYNIFEVPMIEYLKGGGSVKCCTFEF